MSKQVEYLKQEIAEYSLKDFKKELWRFQSLAVLPIEKKVKDLITGKQELPTKFDEVKEFGRWKNIIHFVAPNIAEKIFDFMKEKRLEIEKRKTEAELVELKNSILGIETPDHDNQQEEENSDQSNRPVEEQPAESPIQEWENEEEEKNKNDENDWKNPVKTWVAVGIGGTAAVAGIARWSQYMENLAITRNIDRANISAGQIKETFTTTIEHIEEQKKLMIASGRMSERQVKNIDKTISKLKSGISGVDDEAVDLIKAWNKLDGKIPKKLLKNSGLSRRQLTKIGELSDQLAGKSLDEVNAILKAEKIQGVGDDIVKMLTSTTNPAEIKTMTRILKHGSKINRIIQTFAGAMLIDVAFAWLDVWMYLESQKEADLIEKTNKIRAENKRNQATAQAVIWGASLFIEWWILIWAMCAWAAWWPVGMVAGLAVWLVTTAVSMWVDSLYYDVQDFYKQNREDFVRQKRARLKYTVLQWIHNQKAWNISLNEKLGAPEKWQKEQSLKDAIYTMVFLEEIQNFGYAEFYNYIASWENLSTYKDRLWDVEKWWSPEKEKEFIDKKAEIDTIISKRMEYIKEQLKDTTIVSKIQSGLGMKYLTQIITESKGYEILQKEWKWANSKTYAENFGIYQKEKLSQFPKEKIQRLEKIRKENPYLFEEILSIVWYNSFSEHTIWEEYTENIMIVKEYRNLHNLQQNIENRKSLTIQDRFKNFYFIESIIIADFDIEQAKMREVDDEDIKTVYAGNLERNECLEYSDSVSQNIFYRLAKELYWYEWENNQEAIMNFFSESEWEVQWVYYDDKWKMNIDRAVDSKMTWHTFYQQTFDTEDEVKKYVDAFITANFYNAHYNKNSWKMEYTRKSIIDTPTESIDQNLQKEFEQTLKTIMIEELSQRTQEYQENVKKEIIRFVKKHSKHWWQIELPYYLVIKAKRAGIWDLQGQYFARKGNNLQITGMKTWLDDLIHIDWEKRYIEPLREEFTTEEQWYIDRVEFAHQKLEKIRDKKGVSLSWEDELDLPKEIEILISDKYKEWEEKKANLLQYSGKISISQLKTMSTNFENYFDNLYRGILLTLATRTTWGFKRSNDLDSILYYNQAKSLWEKALFDTETGQLLQGEGGGFSDDYKQIKELYDKQLTEYSNNGKTIAELRKSPLAEDKYLAKESSEKILLAILELALLSEDQQWNITTIRINITDNKINKISKWKLDQRIKQYLENVSVPPQIDSATISIKDSNDQKIITIAEKQTETIKKVNKLQKEIEEESDNLVWQWKRWNIVFDPETSEIKSRWTAVKIKEKDGKYTIDGLQYSWDLKEILFLSNFVNWVQWYYIKKNNIKTFEVDKFFWTIQADLVEWRFLWDVDLLSKKQLKNNLPSFRDADKNSLVIYLNTLLPNVKKNA